MFIRMNISIVAMYRWAGLFIVVECSKWVLMDVMYSEGSLSTLISVKTNRAQDEILQKLTTCSSNCVSCFYFMQKREDSGLQSKSPFVHQRQFGKNRLYK